jgi:putative DNA primase/helicase
MARNNRAVVVAADSDGIDLAATRRFLKLLGAKQFTFQTFDDNSERKNTKLARILHGTLDEHAERLIHLNRLGAGVFVAVNRTDLKGRKRENIQRVRAITVDLDGAPVEPIQRCQLKPHVIVESSPGRYHAYWRVKGLPLDEFEDVQRAIAKRFDGDPEVARLMHVARLPGFKHCKREPFQTRIVEANEGPPHSAKQILAEFPPEQTPHKPPISLAGRLILPTDEPLTCAMEFLRHKFQTDDGIVFLHHYRGSFYRWTGTHYLEIDKEEIRSALYEFLNDAQAIRKHEVVPFKPNASKVNSILDALQAGTLQSRDKSVPFWIPPVDYATAKGLLACRNGLLDRRTRELRPHSPYFFNVNCLPYDFDPNAPPPKQWLAFLEQLWPEDEQARSTLQEIFGLMLSEETRHQKIFMIAGPKRSGKGTIARILTKMLGKDNVTNPTLAGLSSHFGLSHLIDKLAAIISDARLGPQTNAHIVAERLLSISGEDALTIDRKYRDPWTGQLSARFLILTNELPRIADASGALASRFVVLTLIKTFYGREDLELTDKLLGELPGILNWSLEGWDRLRERGHFIIPESSLAAIRTLEDLASPISAFLRDWCVDGPDERADVKVLYDAWYYWCEQHGHKPGSDHVFGRNLHAALPHIRPRGRSPERFYQGVGLSEGGKEQYEATRRSSDQR